MAKKTHIPDRVRLAIAVRYGAVQGVEIQVPCHWCNRPGRVYWYAPAERMGASRVVFGHEVDHVIPEHSGGTSEPDNLVLACRRCNRSKGTKAVPGAWATAGLAMNVRGSPLAHH